MSVSTVQEMLIAHFAVPLAGAVLVAINTRLAPKEVRYICDHSGASLLIVDAELAETVAPVAGALESVREIITITDDQAVAPGATDEAFRGGWFHSGDLGVIHPDGYVQLLDRAKDVVVSGGENISTVEVEQALVSHDCVLEAAVIGIPDDRWGERPKGFVVLKPGRDVSGPELVADVRERIAHHKSPDVIEFVAELPKTSTGKVQKYELRERAWTGHTARING